MTSTRGIAIALTCCFALSLGRAAHAQWGPETPMTATGGDVWGEGIAASGSTVHFVYGTGTISYRRSTDEGATWSDATSVGSGVMHLTDPIVADGDDVWVVYLDAMQSQTDWCCSRDMGTIWLRHSGDAGASWDAPVQLTTESTAFRLSLAYAADRLHLVWMDYRSGAWDTYYLRSPDRGASWDPEVVLAASAGTFGAERPQVAARGDSVHVTIWDDREANPPCSAGGFTFTKCPDVYHVRSLDGGQSWGAITNVAQGGVDFAGRNDIAVAGDTGVIINFNVNVPDDTGSKLFAIASADDGATWQAPIRLTTSPNDSDHGSIIGSGDAVYLAWHDDRDPSNREVYFRRSLDAGGSWEPEEPVSTGAAGDSTTPLDAVTPGYAHVIWLDNRDGSYQVYYRRRALAGSSTDAGTSAVTDGGVASGGAGGSGDGGAAGVGGADSVGGGGDGSGGIDGAGGASPTGGSAGTSGGTGSAAVDEGDPGGGQDAGSGQLGAAEADGGCACRATGRRSDSGWLVLLAFALWGGARQRARAAR
jgi:hypothetical protein